MGELSCVLWPFEGQETTVRCRCGAAMVVFLDQEGRRLSWKPRQCEACYARSCRTSTGLATHIIRSKETWNRLVKLEAYLKA